MLKFGKHKTKKEIECHKKIIFYYKLYTVHKSIIEIILIIIFAEILKNYTCNNTDLETVRAKKLREFQNTSTGIYRLIEILKNNVQIIQ